MGKVAGEDWGANVEIRPIKFSYFILTYRDKFGKVLCFH